MKILVIPEITTEDNTFNSMFDIEKKINSQDNQLKIANMAAWSMLSGNIRVEYTTLEMILGGYVALKSAPEVFKKFNIYIGLVDKEDFPRVSTIIYASEAAKLIAEERGLDENLPDTDETIVLTGEMTLENEIYERTIIYNLSKGQ